MNKSTPLKAIRKYCLYCMNGQEPEIRLCPSKLCLFYPCRFAKNQTSPRVSALKLIKAHCLGCSNDSVIQRKTCWDKKCSLYQYREGHNPDRAGIGPETPLFGGKARQNGVSNVTKSKVVPKEV